MEVEVKGLLCDFLSSLEVCLFIPAGHLKNAPG